MTKRKSDEMNLRLPLVVILGATGSGKTKLSLDLAQRFSGEIIGADSMQIYKALDIITAKATIEERKKASHHMIDILDPHQTFTVVDYRNKALHIIDSLLSQNKLPIVVGGTNYYIESLLWKILVEDPSTDRFSEPGHNNDCNLSSIELHKQLKELDPIMAERLHPNNKRKILRSLEVLQHTGKRHSDILKEQQESFGGSTQGGGLRYPNSIIFWLQCEQNVLDERLDARVDSMIEQGLVQELQNFHKEYNIHRLDSNVPPDYTKGIFQSIGFKEFHKYLERDPSLDEQETAKLLQEGIDALKMVTRRYARKQCRWVTNRFLGRKDREVPPVYSLRTDDVTKWEQNVTNPAIEILDSFISNNPCKYERLPFVDIKSSANSQDETYNCSSCDRIFVGKFQWQMHLKSNKHKKMLQRINNANKKQKIDN